MELNEKLLLLRKNKKLSQESLAEQIGVSRQAVAKWESAQSFPDVEKLISLSDYYKISIDKLLRSDQCDKSLFKSSVKNSSFLPVIDFLCRAKKNTYAANGATVTSSRPDSHDLSYSEDNMFYLDTYLGGDNFAGEEAVWSDNTPVWAMNYVGRILADGFSGSFLKEALFLVTSERPYRGPEIYTNGDYTYCSTISGDFKWFNGTEQIFCNNIKIYECIFHGGDIR